MKYVIDRFEGEFAVCEDENMKFHNILKCKFPQDVKEGNIYYLDGEEYKLDVTEMKRKRKDLKELMDKVFEN